MKTVISLAALIALNAAVVDAKAPSPIANGLNPSTAGGATTGGGSTATQPAADPSAGAGGSGKIGKSLPGAKQFVSQIQAQLKKPHSSDVADQLRHVVEDAQCSLHGILVDCSKATAASIAAGQKELTAFLNRRK